MALHLGYVVKLFSVLPQVCWTGWYDRDDPSGTGDWELLANLQTENLGEICDDPVHIDVVTKNDGIQAFRTGQFFHR